MLWTVTEIFYVRIHQESEDTANNTCTQKRVSKMLSRIDMDTILFFLGILMAVGCLETIGVLTMLGEGLNTAFDGNYYLITGIIGVLSSIVDNVGGSMLIIGSAAGVVVKGLEKITFGWYMKKITWIAFAGYLAGIACYWLEKTFLF